MEPVYDQPAPGPAIRQGCPDRSWIAVGEWRHGIEQMGKAGCSGGQGCFRVGLDDGVEGGIDLGDAVEVGADQFFGGDLAGADGRGLGGGGGLEQRLHQVLVWAKTAWKSTEMKMPSASAQSMSPARNSPLVKILRPSTFSTRAVSLRSVWSGVGLR